MLRTRSILLSRIATSSINPAFPCSLLQSSSLFSHPNAVKRSTLPIFSLRSSSFSSFSSSTSSSSQPLDLISGSLSQLDEEIHRLASENDSQGLFNAFFRASESRTMLLEESYLELLRAAGDIRDTDAVMTIYAHAMQYAPLSSASTLLDFEDEAEAEVEASKEAEPVVSYEKMTQDEFERYLKEHEKEDDEKEQSEQAEIQAFDAHDEQKQPAVPLDITLRKQAENALRDFQKRGSTIPGELTLEFFNGALTALSRVRPSALKAALVVLQDMRKMRVKPDVHTYNTLVEMCVAVEDLDSAMAVVGEMVKNGVIPNSQTEEILVRCIMQEADEDDRESMMSQMDSASIENLPPKSLS